MLKNKNDVIKIKDHPFTQIQLSDREKFHTGMLKLDLRPFSERGLRRRSLEIILLITVFTSEVEEIETCLEENSVDLVITKLPKNENGKRNGEVFAIIESKFKTGLHYSNYKGEKISQLEKYALNNPKTEHGFVVSLFPEEEEDLKIQSKQKAKIHEFKNIRFTMEVLAFLKKPIQSMKRQKMQHEMDRWEKIQDDPSNASHYTLEELPRRVSKKYVGLFEKNRNPLDRITFKEEKVRH